MNSTDLNSTSASTEEMATTGAPDVWSPSPVPKQADATFVQALTTVAPAVSNDTVVAVVIVVILLTVAVLAFLLYRYLCHNKGDYRTTGELAPGEELNEDLSDQAESKKKEYFI